MYLIVKSSIYFLSTLILKNKKEKKKKTKKPHIILYFKRRQKEISSMNKLCQLYFNIVQKQDPGHEKKSQINPMCFLETYR